MIPKLWRPTRQAGDRTIVTLRPRPCRAGALRGAKGGVFSGRFRHVGKKLKAYLRDAGSMGALGVDRNYGLIRRERRVDSNNLAYTTIFQADYGSLVL